MLLHEKLKHENFATQKFPNLWYTRLQTLIFEIQINEEEVHLGVYLLLGNQMGYTLHFNLTNGISPFYL